MGDAHGFGDAAVGVGDGEVNREAVAVAGDRPDAGSAAGADAGVAEERGARRHPRKRARGNGAVAHGAEVEAAVERAVKNEREVVARRGAGNERVHSRAALPGENEWGRGGGSGDTGGTGVGRRERGRWELAAGDGARSEGREVGGVDRSAGDDFVGSRAWRAGVKPVGTAGTENFPVAGRGLGEREIAAFGELAANCDKGTDGCTAGASAGAKNMRREFGAAGARADVDELTER